MKRPEPTALRKQLLGYSEEAFHNPNCGLYQRALELTGSIKDPQLQKQHLEKLLAETQATFETRLTAGIYDQLSLALETVKSQTRRSLRVIENFALTQTNITQRTHSPNSESSSSFPKRKSSEARFSLFALARVTREDDGKAYIGKTYSVQAGISQSKPENFEGEPFDLLVPDVDELVLFDISLHASDNIELVGAWQKYLRFDPQNGEPQLVEFLFRVIAPGPCSFSVDFYRERHLLQTIHVGFDAVQEPAIVHEW